MNVLDDIQQFVKQMEGFEKEPILVKYCRNTNTFCFVQGGKTVFSSLIKYLTLPMTDRVMIMSYDKYAEILTSLSEILSKVILEQQSSYFISPAKYGFKIYDKGFDNNGYYSGPKLVSYVKFYSVKNWLAVRFFLYFYSREFRKFYKYIKSSNVWTV